VPGLRQQHWLEGNRTVLIYGGSAAPSLTEKNTPRCASCAVAVLWTGLCG
jgi:hypothetical protein